MTAPSLHVISAGPDNKPVVVLLHSIATSSAMWHEQIAELAAHYRVFALDLPGHGGSAPLAGEAAIADYAAAVLATLDSLAVERAAVVGLSFGSMIAQHIGAQFPDRVTALVLSNGVAWAAPAVSALWHERVAEADRNGMHSQVEPTLLRWFTEAFRSANAPMVDQIRQLVAATSPKGYRQAGLAIASLDNRALLPRITAPTLLIAGEADGAAPASAITAMADEIPCSNLVILPGAHLLNVERSAEYSNILTGFLDEVHQPAEPEANGGRR